MREEMGINWPEILRRLESVNAGARDGGRQGREEAAHILEARARALALEPPAEDSGEHMEVLEFHLAYETYAFETRYVREVYPLERLTPIPCTPDFALGIVNVRGEIFSVVDVRKFFELPEKGLTDLNKLIVIESAAMRFGILADSIVGTRRFPIAEIQPSLPTLNEIRQRYLKGITSERTIVLDAAKLLADERIVVQEQPG